MLLSVSQWAKKFRFAVISQLTPNPGVEGVAFAKLGPVNPDSPHPTTIIQTYTLLGIF